MRLAALSGLHVINVFNVHARLAVEAGCPQGWGRWVGDHGAGVSVNRFGASAPGDVLLREYGFTVDNICSRAKALLSLREQCASKP